VRIAFCADIHGNRAAFEACLRECERRGFDQMVILGDVVGYGPDPQWCTDQVRELQAKGAVVDAALVEGTASMNELARTAIEWTLTQLDNASIEYLAKLPLSHRQEDRLYVHANAWAPALWDYINSPREAERSMRLTDARLSFCGHTHVPLLYHMSAKRPASAFTPLTGKAIPLSTIRRYLMVVGAVGQPRDRNPAACWALYDTAKREYTIYRTSYDIELTARKIRETAMPQAMIERLAKRLFAGS
jgi:diadenosine tetraphosphatase ApaH/serine/threonine PP2A family protein phosphatase